MDKSIVVTGAGTGLGRAIARRLARDGHRFALLGRRLARVQAVADEIGNGAIAISCDVTDDESVEEAFLEVAKWSPRLDVLINNAAVVEPHLVGESTNAQLEAMIDTNLTGPIRCVRAALPLMERGGQILNIGSKSAVDRAAMLPFYQTAKAGLEKFNKVLRQEVSDQGIRATLVRAGGMVGDDMEFSIPPELMARFTEERRKLGLTGKGTVSQYQSVAEIFPWLLNLPVDVDLPEVALNAREP